MFKNKRLAYKLNISILSAVFLIFSLILIYNYYISRKLILKSVRENTKNLTSSAINKSEGFFRVIEKIAQNASYIIRDSEKSKEKEEIDLVLSSIVYNNDEIYGSCLAFSPYKFRPGIKYYAPYYYEKGKTLLYKNLADGNYYYPGWEWYRRPIEKGGPVWSEPYFDTGGGNELMTTYSVPLYKQQCKTDSLIGVITADVSLKWLQKIVSQIKIFNTGFAFLISQKGTIITHPDTNYVMRESIFSLAEKFNDPALRKIGQDMITGHEDFVPIKSKFYDGNCWIYYTHLTNNDWSLGFVFPEKELYADLLKLNQMLIIIALAGLVLLLILIITISNRVTRPLQNLALIAQGFGTGNFDLEIPPSTSGDEVGTLNKSFSHMQAALKKYIENLKQTTSAKEKIESELKIARDIQMGMIPRIFPAFPDRKEFDIYGFIEPAKEVGGDLYDFFFIDDERLCFVIGDVAGKGMPAALFMAITKTYLHAESQIAGLSASRIIELVNNYLCKENESNLFVTLFFGILNTAIGEVEFVNAGHNYPFIIRNDGTVSELTNSHCIPLGINMNLCKKPSAFISLDAGDMIFLYTDGINEAFNMEDQEYSISRIDEVLTKYPNTAPREMIHHIVRDVNEFSQGTEQSDDMTLLGIKYFGKQSSDIPGQKHQLLMTNSIKNLSQIYEKTTRLCEDKGIPSEFINTVNLVVEELVSNIILYGYTDDLSHDIIFNFQFDRESIKIEIIDDGKEFDPVAMKDADTTPAISERKIGGLGIHLVKNLADAFTYQREGGKNITRISIRHQ
jgi:sigma-B regulation protein RsbU (phosphoserine phosphatase)